MCLSKSVKRIILQTKTGCVLLVLMFILTSTASTSADPITITDNISYSAAYDGNGGDMSDSFYGTTIPTSTAVTATDGGSSSVTSIDYYCAASLIMTQIQRKIG